MLSMHKTNGAAQKCKALSGRKRKLVSSKGESNNHENVIAKQAKTIQGNGTSEAGFQSRETKVENKTDPSQPIHSECIAEAQQFDANNIILDYMYNPVPILARSQDDIMIGVSNSKTVTSDNDDFVPLSQPARIKPNFSKRKTFKKYLTSFQSHKKDKTPGSTVVNADLMTEASETISLHKANISTRTSDTTGTKCNVKTLVVLESNDTKKTTVTYTSNSPGPGPGKSSHGEEDKIQRKTISVTEKKGVVEEPFENFQHSPLGTINGTEYEDITVKTPGEVFPHTQKTVNLTSTHVSFQDEQQIIGNIFPLQSRDNRAVMKEVSEIGTATADEPERSTSSCESQYSNTDCESVEITIAFEPKEGSTAQMQGDMDISACEYRDTSMACEAGDDTKSCKVGNSITRDATTTCVEPDNSSKTCSSRDNVTDHELCERNMDCKSADSTKSCSLVVDTSAIPGDSTMVSTPVICAMASNPRDCTIPDMAGDNTEVFKLRDNTTAIEPKVAEVLSQCIEELRPLEVPQIVGVKTVSQSDECPDISDSQLFQLGEDLMKEDQAGMGNGLACHYPVPGENASSVDHSKTCLQSPAHALTAPQKLVQLRSTRDVGAAVPPQEKHPDTKETRMLKGLISELTSLNTMLMQFKREMDQLRHKRPNYLGTHKKCGR
ncbi:uncharacterized protein LOC106166185 [Lingula anatina]|uniref:Uncharacterized protein LOC106166185 n=1 Tax=Lingula anatina TaxID=7574 RepID=A0A1S3IRG1_LINAN|nr:uncharacterized protein LOC106166185 [Lingula anatina]|eukprot:XP_013400114.1 uncharacterized protein LOC106166185 [Lingula anatina]